mgnify:CR=1 FL=1
MSIIHYIDYSRGSEIGLENSNLQMISLYNQKYGG